MSVSVAQAAALLLVIVANGAPLLMGALFRDRGAWRADLGATLFDGFALFGATKTVRGIVAAVLMTSLTAGACGLPLRAGSAVGALAMTGDLLTSFLKRRLGLKSSARVLLFDHVPECVLPCWYLVGTMGFDFIDLLAVTASFACLAPVITAIFRRVEIGIRPIVDGRWPRGGDEPVELARAASRGERAWVPIP